MGNLRCGIGTLRSTQQRLVQRGTGQREVVEGDVEEPVVAFGNLERLRRAVGESFAVVVRRTADELLPAVVDEATSPAAAKGLVASSTTGEFSSDAGVTGPNCCGWTFRIPAMW